MTITGGSDTMLFIREFLDREKDQIAAAAHLEEVKKRNAQQLAADQERYERQLAEDREYYDRMLERSEAMFQQALQQAAAERAADRQAFLDAIARLTDAINNHNRRNRRSNLRNGNGSANPSP